MRGEGTRDESTDREVHEMIEIHNYMYMYCEERVTSIVRVRGGG